MLLVHILLWHTFRMFSFCSNSKTTVQLKPTWGKKCWVQSVMKGDKTYVNTPKAFWNINRLVGNLKFEFEPSNRLVIPSLRGQGHFHFAKYTSIGKSLSLWETFEGAPRLVSRTPEATASMQFKTWSPRLKTHAKANGLRVIPGLVVLLHWRACAGWPFFSWQHICFQKHLPTVG